MRALIVVLALLCPGVVLSEGVDDEGLPGFLEGKYYLIGKVPGSDETYSGEVEIRKKGRALLVLRTVGNVRTQGIATVERATADKISVLRIRLASGAVDQEETCMIGSDLDNYPRMTCYLYKAGSDASVSPGLEALFIKQH